MEDINDIFDKTEMMTSNVYKFAGMPPRMHNPSSIPFYQRYQNENSTIHSHLPCTPWVKFSGQYLNSKAHGEQKRKSIGFFLHTLYMVGNLSILC